MGTYTDEDFEQLKELVVENNKILKRLRRKANVSTIFTVIRWTIIIGVAIGAFTLLQPFMEGVMENYRSFTDGISSINEAKNNVSDLSLPEFMNLIKN